jgi:hypothetical protein
MIGFIWGVGCIAAVVIAVADSRRRVRKAWRKGERDGYRGT